MSITDKEANLILAGSLLKQTCYQASFNAGWWDGDIKSNPFCFSNKLCLIHSEISEAMEGDRKSLQDDKLPHRPAREVELADALIRIYDLAGAYNLDIEGALVEKMKYNLTRKDHSLEARALTNGKSY